MVKDKACKDKITKGYKCAFLLIIALFWAMIIFVIRPFEKAENLVSRTEISEGKVADVTEPLSSDVTLEQMFIADQQSMCGLSVYFDTFGEQRYGKVIVSLLSESGKVLAEEKIDMSTLEDKGYYNIAFDRIQNSKGKCYVARITSTVNDSKDGVGVWYRDKAPGSNYATINGEKLEGTLRMKAAYCDRTLYNLQLVCWAVMIVLSVIFALTISPSYENNFLRLAFLLGILVVFVTPFPHVIDESTHFFRSFMISQGDFYDDTFVGRIGGNVPVNFTDYVDNGKLSIKSLYTDLEKWMSGFDNEKDFYFHPYMSSSIPINHSFAAVGILLSRLLHLPALFVILSGRLITYLIYVVLCYFAIKKAKYYKGMFFMVSTLPVSIWLAGSYSIDPMVLSSALLYTSICLRHFFDKGGQLKLTKKEKAALLITALMFASVKYLIYSPILLMIFLIPKDRFGKKERAVVCISGVLVFAGLMLWQIYLLNRFPFVEDRNGDVNVSRQISHVFANIPGTIRIFLNYIDTNLLPHIEGFNNFKSLSFITPMIGLMTIFGSVFEPDRYPFTDSKDKRKLAVLCGGIFIICSLLIMASLYVGFTPVGSEDIEGLQTRYFLPILIFAMIPISMVKVTNSINNYREKITLLMGIGILDMLADLLEGVF